MSGRTDTINELVRTPPMSFVDSLARARVRDRLVDGVAASVGDLPSGALVEVTLASIRRARSHPEALGRPEEPFAWKPVFVRRSLGLAAVRSCAEGRFALPSAAVGPVADQAVEEWERTGQRTFHWEPWFAGLGVGGRAVVLAEAAAWATSLWAAFDWTTLNSQVRIGGMDDLWTCPAPRTVRLKGRSEVRTRLDMVVDGRRIAGSDGGPSALVSVSGGVPSEGWREDLAYLALVAGLRAPDRPVPARVVGLWPDAAEERTVEIDEAALDGAVDRVVATVAMTAAAARSTSDDRPGCTSDSGTLVGSAAA